MCQHRRQRDRVIRLFLRLRLGGGTTTRISRDEYLFGPGIDEPLAKRDVSGTITYYAADGLGSIVAETQGGTIVRGFAYSPFGISLSTTPERFGYTARERGDSYLYYYRARYYDPRVGRFLSEDPLTSAGGRVAFSINNDGRPSAPDTSFDVVLSALRASHPYAYVQNDPVLATDPLGAGKYPIICAYYIWKCAEHSKKCVEDLKCKLDQMTDDDIASIDSASISAEQYKKCFAGTKSCKKMLNWCGPDYAKAPPGFPPLSELPGAPK